MTDYYVLHSGGIDSTTALTIATQRPDARRVTAVSVMYGQRHKIELDHARKIRKHLNVEHIHLNLSSWGSTLDTSLTSNGHDVPEGYYAEGTSKDTEVPGRNAIMLTALAGLAANRNKDEHPIALMFGANGTDTSYADCSPEFVSAINKALAIACGVTVEAPVLSMSKTAVIKTGAKIGAPLGLTYSCYKGTDPHCGVCSTCLDRREAFIAAGIPDPTEYQQ